MDNIRAEIFVILFSLAMVEPYNTLSEKIIELIKAQQTLWTAGRNYSENIPRKITGTIIDEDDDSKLHVVNYDPPEISDLPESFDCRQKWPYCPSINEIQDQGCCNSAWAFAPVSAMTDRVCIFSGGTSQERLSADDLISCSGTGNGNCEGGDSRKAWQYWHDEGIVSGGPYHSDEGCRPYEIPNDPKENPCTHFMSTPNCTRYCRTGYYKRYQQDKIYGERPDIFPEHNFKIELWNNGPFSVGFQLYEDFLSYKSGVYKHLKGKKIGSHTAKILGWGVEKGQKYWLLANSWNTTWGEGGFVKFLQGQRICRMFGTAASPKL